MMMDYERVRISDIIGYVQKTAVYGSFVKYPTRFIQKHISNDVTQPHRIRIETQKHH